jgi:hypothetical protein
MVAKSEVEVGKSKKPRRQQDTAARRARASQSKNHKKKEKEVQTDLLVDRAVRSFLRGASPEMKLTGEQHKHCLTLKRVALQLEIS